MNTSFLKLGKTDIQCGNLMEIVLQHGSHAIAILDKNLIILYASSTYYQDSDLKGNKIAGQHFYEIFPNVTDEWKEINRRALNGETICRENDFMIHSDGSIEHIRWECFPWYDTAGQIGGIIVYTTYISDLAHERETRRLREDDVHEAYQIAGMGRWETRVGAHELKWSDTTYEIFEIDKNCRNLFETYCATIHPDDRDWVLKIYGEMIPDNNLFFTTEYRIRMNDGRVKWVMQTCRVQYDAMRKPVNIVGIVQDITEVKNHEETLRCLVEEKDTLLVELRHRIKNNLQVMTNLLSLEIAKNSDKAIKQALNESLSRLQSMAMVYEQLHRSNSYTDIDLDWYLKELTTILFRAYTSQNSNLKLVTNFKKTRIDSDRVVLLGLILNELIMNSVKYAYPQLSAENKSSPNILSREIRVCLENLGDSAVLSVEDDGYGLPVEFESPESAGTGLKLVDTLTRQLGGICKISSLGGTQVAIRFPL